MLTGLVTCALFLGSAAGMELDAPPPGVPSGLDLLYSDRVAFNQSGEPILAMGLMSGQKSIRIRLKDPVQLDFYDRGQLRTATLARGRTLELHLKRSAPATQSHYVDLDGLAWNKGAELESALLDWYARGFTTATALEEGTVMGIGGKVLDNRQYRLIVPTATKAEARRIAAQVYQRFGQRAQAHSRLVERPWGELRVSANGVPMGTATSYVRLSPMAADTHITVLQVEHSKGYRWHGFQDRSYRGEIYVVVDPEGTLAAVNVVGAETVLKGVVPSELFASAHPQALRAQAIAARNHLLAKLGRRHHGDPFHLCSEQHCQVYTGVNREDARTSAAVDATWGEAMFHHGHLVHAMYSSTCGGHTEHNDVAWSDDADPALRAVPDFDPQLFPQFAGGLNKSNLKAWVDEPPVTYCSQASSANLKKFRWRKNLSGAEANAMVAKSYPKLGRLRSASVIGRGPGGKVKGLRLKGEHGSATVPLELPIRRLFGNLNSGAFLLDTRSDPDGFVSELRFRGGGWGHGVGMCQLGAIGRAEAGHDYLRILRHYYNEATIESLYQRSSALSLR